MNITTEDESDDELDCEDYDSVAPPRSLLGSLPTTSPTPLPDPLSESFPSEQENELG